MKIFWIYFILIFGRCKADEPDAQKKVPITAKIYSNMLIRRREEQKMFVKHLLKSDYEKKYKLVELAFDKIFEIIKDNNATLHQSDYNAKSGFPQEDRLQSAVTLIIENTCLAGEIIIKNPEISYRILKKRSAYNWKDLLLKSINFVMEFPQLIQEDTVTMLSLFQQEINVSDRTDDYTNPYNKARIEEMQKPKIKVRKRLKKGPQLSTNKIEL